MKHLEFASPEVLYAAARTLTSVKEARMMFAARGTNRVIEQYASRLRYAGLLTHDAGDRVIVTADSVDVDAMWLRAREITRIRMVRHQADAVRYIADRDARLRSRRDRTAARRHQAVEDEDLAAFML